MTRECGRVWRSLLTCLVAACVALGTIPACAEEDVPTVVSQGSEAKIVEVDEAGGVEGELVGSEVGERQESEDAIVAEAVEDEQPVDVAAPLDEEDASTIAEDESVIEESAIEESDTKELDSALRAQTDLTKNASHTTTKEAVSQQTSGPALTVNAHIQSLGDKTYSCKSGKSLLIGTTGRSLRLEGFGIRLLDAKGKRIEGISYKAYAQSEGWQAWKSDGAFAGTRGKALRVEAIKLSLANGMENTYDVWYRAHIQKQGWLAWTRNGKSAGSVGKSLRVEAIEVRVLPKGSSAPGTTSGSAFIDGSGICGDAYVQRLGWRGSKTGKSLTLGTIGRSLRLEGLRLSAEGFDMSGGVRYETHVQSIGWQGARANGRLAGTTGQSLRLEAIKLSLTGQLAKTYDVWYRVHAQSIGWMGWACNGEAAGTSGASRRLEAVQIRLRKKGAEAPSSDGAATQLAYLCGENVAVKYASYVQGTGWQATVENGRTSGRAGKGKRIESLSASIDTAGLDGRIEYRVRVQSSGWTAWKRDGAKAGTSASKKRVEAIQFRLKGAISSMYNVWYRTYVQDLGWLGWTRDGAQAGNSIDRRIEAYQVKLIPKGNAAPGSTVRPFVNQLKHPHMVFIGDSRTCSLYDTRFGADTFDLYTHDSEGNTWSSRVGAGLAWMRDVGVPRAEGDINSETAVVILMGVNDVVYGSSMWNGYIDYINDKAPQWIARGASVYYVSVGPIGLHTGIDSYTDSSGTITNSGTITRWNNAMRQGLNTGCQYLDAYSTLIQDYKTAEGLHYERSTDRVFFQFLQDNVF